MAIMTDLTKISLSKHSEQELLELKYRIDQELIQRREQERETALGELRRRAQSMGFELEELLGMEKKKPAARAGKKAASKGRFVNPADATQSWSGKGRKPAWVIAWLEAGNTMEQLEA